MKKRKKLFIFVIALLVIIVSIYSRPVKLSKMMDNKGETLLQIAYIKGSEDVTNPDMKTEMYKINSGSDEYNKIYNLFDKYYCHAAIDTLTKDTLIKGIDETLIIKGNKHKIILTDTSKIIIDNTPYKVGYIGNEKSKMLMKELLSVIVTD